MDQMIKYAKEIDKLFSEMFRESWMTDDDWKQFIENSLSEADITQLSNDIQIGIDNGFSVESQLNLVKDLAKSEFSKENRSKTLIEPKLLDKFTPDMKEMILVDSLSRSVFERLLFGHSPYALLEELLKLQIKTTSASIEAEINAKRPIQYIICEDCDKAKLILRNQPIQS